MYMNGTAYLQHNGSYYSGTSLNEKTMRFIITDSQGNMKVATITEFGELTIIGDDETTTYSKD